MTVGLVRNQRDADVIEILGGRKRYNCTEWPYVWATVHTDCIGDAIEGELLNNGGERFEGIIECVIIKWSEWDQLTKHVEELERENEHLAQEINALERQLEQYG